MKFLTDEHIEISIVTALKERIDIVSIDGIGKKGLSDTEILELAEKDKRAVITRDSDFLRLHAKGAKHSGIIFIPKFLSVGSIIKETEVICLLFKPEDLKNNVVFLPLK
ncbi:MAG: DUF5615 family PIN-like protein [Candidatus Aenigmarchaeota archaeon]|nr:DUF5615 family PIN-like protein [Candidatus Aenigmarchaeota archaeon]